MKYELKGKTFVFGNNVDTDQIYPARFVQFTDIEDVAKYAMTGADPEFIQKVSTGDIIVAGTNFGCGSSREHAAITLKAVGISVIIAESFGRIFFRNGINLGIPLIVCPNITRLVNNEEIISVDLSVGQILRNKKTITTIEPLSDYILNILESGGIKPLIKNQLEAENK